MRLLFLSAVLLFSAMAVLPVSAAQWQLNPVPQTTGNPGKPDYTLNVKKPFQVVLGNRTSHDLRIWQESCAWGYSSLSFEFKSKDGKIITVEKNRDVTWKNNNPIPFIAPGGSPYIITVDFSAVNSRGKKIWAGAEALNGIMSMRARYQNTYGGPPSKEEEIKLALLHKPNPYAWVGKVHSAWVPVTIER